MTQNPLRCFEADRPFYSSHAILDTQPRTGENKAGVDSCYISVSTFGEIRTWAVKLFGF